MPVMIREEEDCDCHDDDDSYHDVDSCDYHNDDSYIMMLMMPVMIREEEDCDCYDDDDASYDQGGGGLWLSRWWW